MTTNGPTEIPPLRLSLLLWLAGMLGVVVITIMVLPKLLGELPLPAPLWVISLASFAQSGLLIALAVWSGVALASKVGLHAPTFEAAVTARSITSALRPQLFPGLVTRVLGGQGCSPSAATPRPRPSRRYSSALPCRSSPACSMAASRRKCFCAGGS